MNLKNTGHAGVKFDSSTQHRKHVHKRSLLRLKNLICTCLVFLVAPAPVRTSPLAFVMAASRSSVAALRDRNEPREEVSDDDDDDESSCAGRHDGFQVRQGRQY